MKPLYNGWLLADAYMESGIPSTCRMSRLKILEHQSWHVLDKVDVIEHITLTALMVGQLTQI